MRKNKERKVWRALFDVGLAASLAAGVVALAATVYAAPERTKIVYYGLLWAPLFLLALVATAPLPLFWRTTRGVDPLFERKSVNGAERALNWHNKRTCPVLSLDYCWIYPVPPGFSLHATGLSLPGIPAPSAGSSSARPPRHAGHLLSTPRQRGAHDREMKKRTPTKITNTPSPPTC